MVIPVGAPSLYEDDTCLWEARVENTHIKRKAGTSRKLEIGEMIVKTL